MTNIVRAVRSIAVTLTPALLLTLGMAGAAAAQNQPLERLPQVRIAPEGANALLGAPDPRRDLHRYAAYVQGLVDPFWAELFKGAGVPYQSPRLVITERDGTSACGRYSARSGPFYCSADRTIYLPAGYFSTLFRGEQLTPGNFAPAYVLAHEWAHHVQALYGLQAMRNRELQKGDRLDRQHVNINYELQADCFAGVWARSAFGQGMLEPGDVEAAQGAAMRIGDDNLGLELRDWGHGSSAERLAWFNHGFEVGDASKCRLRPSGAWRTQGQRQTPSAQTVMVGRYQISVPQGSTLTRLQNGVIQLQQGGITAHIGAPAPLTATPASQQLGAAMGAWNREHPLVLVGTRLPRQYPNLGGSSATHAYQQNAGTLGVVHGLFLLHAGSGPTPEGLVVDVFASGPAEGARDWQQLDQYARTVMSHVRFMRAW
jgi:predicted metalloprotease